MCEICDDSGFVRMDVPVGDPNFGHLQRCTCRAQEDNHRLQALSGLTASERSIRLANIVTSGRPGTIEMVKAGQAFMQRPAGILTLWGGVGNAKTMVLQAVVNELIAQKVPGVYVTAFDLISYIRSAFNNKREIIDDDAYGRLMRFERVRILALDEFDKVRVTDWVLEQLTDLIDKRYRIGLDGTGGTLIAMNEDPAEQPDWIASRLFDGRNQIIHNTDGDIRPGLRRRA